MKRIILIAIAMAALVACEKKEETAKTDQPAQPNATATTNTNAPTTLEKPNAQTPTAAAPQIAESDLITPADFEEEAEKAITAKNYKNELKTLETAMTE